MALSELAAVEAAYQVLHPLDAAGRRRALQWLSDALGAEGPLPEFAPAAATSAGPAGEDRALERVPATKSAPARTPRRRAGTGAEATAAETETPAGRPRRVRAARQAAAPVVTRERMYRRMPPAEQVIAAYQQVGSISGLADHFNVPTYTAQGWARQLRKQGHAIGRAS
ncbi:hypothetical protein AB0K00_21600 [Dactylosporangium sp. NPDC049525]|uniref:hypothetical protein n=1 Tax=Dactylosporangium sp. NPDC049525 TaxID=3154730 RepID=UPI00343CA884